MTMRSTKAAARWAGVLYLLSGFPGVFSYLYIPGAFIVPGDAAATARHITDATLTYRVGILSDVVGQVFLVFLVLSLYSLLKDVDRRYARSMVILVAVGVAFEMANVLNLMAPLILLGSGAPMSAFASAQLDALALGFLTVRSDGLLIAQVFWGLWLFPFGVLVMRSGLFPKLLGILLIVACFAYVTDSVVFIVFPAYTHPLTHIMKALGGLGEGAMILWLLIKGAYPAPLASQSATAVA
jgi:hypothetical protein